MFWSAPISPINEVPPTFGCCACVKSPLNISTICVMLLLIPTLKIADSIAVINTKGPTKYSKFLIIGLIS